MDNQMSQQFVTMKSQLLKNTAQSTRDRIATVAGVPQHLGHLELMKRLLDRGLIASSVKINCRVFVDMLYAIGQAVVATALHDFYTKQGPNARQIWDNFTDENISHARIQMKASYRELLCQVFVSRSADDCQEIAAAYSLSPDLRDVALAQTLADNGYIPEVASERSSNFIATLRTVLQQETVAYDLEEYYTSGGEMFRTASHVPPPARPDSGHREGYSPPADNPLMSVGSQQPTPESKQELRGLLLDMGDYMDPKYFPRFYAAIAKRGSALWRQKLTTLEEFSVALVDTEYGVPYSPEFNKLCDEVCKFVTDVEYKKELQAFRR